MTPQTAQPQSPAPTDETGFNALAAVFAFLFPGAGHLFLGELRRGLYIMAGLLGMFFGGLLIGGIDSIDSKEDHLWYYGQAILGPVVFIADGIHQGLKVNDQGVVRSANPGEGRDPATGTPTFQPAAEDPTSVPPYIKGIGKANELGTLTITLAGMLNVIVLLDALLPPLRYGRKKAAA